MVPMLQAMPTHVGAAEIRDMLGGISRQRVQQLINRKDWPKPLFELKMGKVWDRADVEQWMRDHGREATEDDDG
jgi:prophage regulatory protein